MPTRNVVLTDHQHDMSEVPRDGLRLVERREAEDATRLEAPHAAAQVGRSDLEASRYRDMSEAGLADYVRDLGQRAAERMRAGG